jgi:hypothetical protein
MAKSIKNSPKILGLDVSTKTIGWALFDLSSRDLLELTHISPRPKPTSDNKMEELTLPWWVWLSMGFLLIIYFISWSMLHVSKKEPIHKEE